MKTKIIQLESQDDIISARDKMTWGKSSRILLVWPRWGIILRRWVDLVLIQGLGGTLGAQVAQVTRDRVVKSFVYEIGIPVFNSSKQAQKYSWDQLVGACVFTRALSRKRPDPKVLHEEFDLLHQRPDCMLDFISIRLLPSWWPFLPYIPFRIEVFTQ